MLIDNRFIDERRFYEVLALQLGFQQVTPDYASIDRAKLEKVNLNWCAKNLVVPMRPTGPTARRQSDGRDAYRRPDLSGTPSDRS